MKYTAACALAMFLLPLGLAAQQHYLDPDVLTKREATDAWPTYHGDYSGKGFSPLDQINKLTVGTLQLAWQFKAVAGVANSGNVGGPGRPGDSMFWGAPSEGFRIGGAPLMVNGVMYFAGMDRAWAVDARTGRELWRYFFQTRGGHHNNANKGMGMYGTWLYFETPDCYLVSLDAATGKERWYKAIAPVEMDYYCSTAPLVIRNHLYTGIGGDAIDEQGWLDARDPETGEVQWRWYTTPQNPGDPGYDSWPDEYASKHGGGMTWQPLTYDPDLNLVYVATGNANPVGAGQSRPGNNLFTCSLVALDADSGKMKWYFQGSPHDTHDWDCTEAPVLFDGTWNSQPRKLVGWAIRAGFFFLLDRTTGQNLLTRPLGDPRFTNHTLGVDSKGQIIPNPKKAPQIDGTLVGPGSATNWHPPTFSPRTGLFYVGTTESLGMSYLVDTSERPEGYAYKGGGGGETDGQSGLRAIDYHTGETKWLAEGGNTRGLLSTAGGLVFGADAMGGFAAFDDETGKILWRFPTQSSPTNGPSTWMLDGYQFVIVACQDMVYAFTLNRPQK